MPNAFFELDKYAELPLWAQVFMASRLVRRAVLWLPDEPPGTDRARAVLLPGCDAVDRLVRAGDGMRREEANLQPAKDFQPTATTHAVSTAMYYLIDSTAACIASTDFGAAETACTNSAGKAMECVTQSPGLNPLQVRVFAAADLDLLRFNCGEFRIGRYDALSDDVLQRMIPVHPPSARDRVPHVQPDPTNGAR